MNKINTIILLSNVFLFLIIISLLNRIFDSYQDKRKVSFSLNLRYDPKGLLFIFLAAISLTYVLSNITFSYKTDTLLFLSLMGLLPYVISGEIERRKKEGVFADIIIYCHNVTMLLRQNRNVYSALQRVKEDIHDPLKSDIENLLVAFEKSKEETTIVMNEIEEKYNFSCIKNLNLIMMYMFFENSDIAMDLLDTFQDDIEKLDQDVKSNQSKRKTLRLQYVLITTGSLLAYWLLLREIKDTFAKVMETASFEKVNTIFLFVVLLCLFYVDRFFNNNTTKE